MPYTHALATNQFGVAAFIVDATAANGTHTTIASALSQAVSGQTIFIKPGTYVENLTLVAGVNLTSFEPTTIFGIAATSPSNVIIVGKCSFSSAGTVGINGITLKTNSDFCLSITGSVASLVVLTNCYLQCSNNTGIQFSSSSASSGINLNYCGGSLDTTGIAIFAHSGAGILRWVHTQFNNAGSSLTANTISGTGIFQTDHCLFFNPLTASSSSTSQLYNSNITGVGNQIAITTSNTASVQLIHAFVSSGSASAISVGAGTTVELHYVFLNCSNGATITGTGNLQFTNLTANSVLALDAGLTLNNSNMKSFISSGGIGASGEVWTSNGASTPPSFQAASTGALVQQTRGSSTTASTGTTTFTLGTTPTTAGGTQILSASITPTNSSHILLIEYSYFMDMTRSSTANSGVISAIFQDATVNCLYSQLDTTINNLAVGAVQGVNVKGRFYMTAGTTSSTTFKVRIGMYGAASNWYFLEDSTATGMGGTQFASLTITEYTS